MFTPTFKIKTSSFISIYKAVWLLVLQANILVQKEQKTKTKTKKKNKKKKALQIIKKKQYKFFIFQLIAVEFDWEILYLYYYGKGVSWRDTFIKLLTEQKFKDKFLYIKTVQWKFSYPACLKCDELCIALLIYRSWYREYYHFSN